MPRKFGGRSLTHRGPAPILTWLVSARKRATTCTALPASARPRMYRNGGASAIIGRESVGQADMATEAHPAPARPRFSRAHGDEGWAAGALGAPPQGPGETGGGRTRRRQAILQGRAREIARG